MPAPEAPSTLIDALKASIADEDHGWSVVSASESDSTKIASVGGVASTSNPGSTYGSISVGGGIVSGVVIDGDGSIYGDIAGGGGAVVGSSAGSSSSGVVSIETRESALSVDLLSAALYQSAANMQLSYRSVRVPTVVVLESGSSWTVPDDWNSADNWIEVIGGGGGGGAATGGSNSAAGGGGGAYSRTNNLSLTPGASVAYAVGAAGAGGVVSGTGASAGSAGGDTWFNGASLAASTVGAKGGNGGGAGSTAAAGTGGAAASGIGSLRHSGGNGSAVATGGSPGASGGGGAAGSHGAGLPSSVPGAGGATSGGSADQGRAAAGGTAVIRGNNVVPAGPGAIGIGLDATHGPGGGGGAIAGSFGTGAAVAGAGGRYGGGGGGASAGNWNSATGGAGGQGVIVVSYMAFSYATMRQAGAEFTATDVDLDDAIRAMVAEFQSNTAAAIEDILVAGPQPPDDPDTFNSLASPGLVTALKSSLADPDAQWSVIGRAVNVIRDPQGGGESTLSMVVVRVDRMVSLSSPVIRVAVGSYAPLTFTYIGQTSAAGGYLAGELVLDGKVFGVSDETLHDQIMEIAGDDVVDVDADVTASLTLGPQTFEDA